MIAKLIAVVPLAAIAVGGTWLSMQDQDPAEVRQNSSTFMERKLDRAREIVEGLAIEDFDMISKSAQSLALLSHESEWKVMQSETYSRMSSEFRNSAIRLRDAGNQENLDGATLAYFEVTLNCVRCHKYVRDNPKDLQVPLKNKRGDGNQDRPSSDQ